MQKDKIDLLKEIVRDLGQNDYTSQDRARLAGVALNLIKELRTPQETFTSEVSKVNIPQLESIPELENPA